MRALILTVLALIGVQAWAHGESEFGPHGGFISMPGAFHVELVPVNKSELKVYLIDMHWKNPTLKDSSVEVIHDKASAKCTAQKDHFLCVFDKTINLEKAGELKVNATREKQKGNTAKYSLPLKLAPMKH